MGGQTTLDLPNDHLQYAITWYAPGRCARRSFYILLCCAADAENSK